jgi:hypothetical protein
MVMASLPRQPHYVLVSRVGGRAKYSQKRVWVFLETVRYFCPILVRTEFYRQFFINIQQHTHISKSGIFHGNRETNDGQTGGYDEVNRLFSQLLRMRLK